MDFKEMLWIVFVSVYTIYRISFASSIAYALGVLVGGAVIGFLPIYILRKLKKKKKNRRKIENGNRN